ncbi:hypothetical protein QTN25_005493 [Entamoeba marina]
MQNDTFISKVIKDSDNQYTVKKICFEKLNSEDFKFYYGIYCWLEEAEQRIKEKLNYFNDLIKKQKDQHNKCFDLRDEVQNTKKYVILATNFAIKKENYLKVKANPNYIAVLEKNLGVFKETYELLEKEINQGLKEFDLLRKK